MPSSKQEAVFITKWKAEMMRRVFLRFPDTPWNEKKINKYLDRLIHERMKNPNVVVVNNYRNQSVSTDLLSLIDTIEKNQLIIGGGGVLFVQHDTPGRENVLFGYITNLGDKRNLAKAERKKYEKNSPLWVRFDIRQNNIKVKNNSLYGVHGYPGFALYNRYLAEAVTNMGRQIITTAVMTFENFLSGASVQMNTEEEIWQFITHVVGEYDERIDYEIFDSEEISTESVIQRILDMCAFHVTGDFQRHLTDTIRQLPRVKKIMLFYKNNLYAFSRHPIIREKLRYVVKNLTHFWQPDKSKIEDVTIRDMLDDIWGFYQIFVVYNYAMYDRVRKSMFTDRKSVLYVDTDSNFLGLNPWLEFIRNDVLTVQDTVDPKEFVFTSVNMMALFLSNTIDLGLKTLARNMNVTDKYAKILNMKNEFYMDRIIFTSAKKRYISNTILQEGELIKGGAGLPDIKGFDFKKAHTKQYLREYYTKLCLEKILRAESIDVEDIYRSILALRDEIMASVEKGEDRFFKQSTVQILEHYKEPYSEQPVVATLLWNTLNPEYAMELPADCDIVPIRELTGPKVDKKTGRVRWPREKFVMEFKEKYPEAYDRLERDIYNNGNECIRQMGLKAIAKPKNSEIPLPEWFAFLVDKDKIQLDALKLIEPVLASLGLNGLKTNANTTYMTNIIDL